MPPAMKRWPVACCWLVLSGWGCSDARLVDNSSERAPRIRVSPQAFAEGLPCQPGAPGAFQGYVARLEWVTDTGGSVDAGASGAVQWSPFVPCGQAVVFPAATGRSYAADIRGFDRVLTDDELETAESRWTATCGRGSPSGAPDAGADPFAPTLASRGAIVPMQGCTSFTGATGLGNLVVDVQSALGDLVCGPMAGQVAYLQARLGSAVATAACGTLLSIPVSGASRYHTLELIGLELNPDAGAPSPFDDAGAPNESDSGVVDAGTADGDASADAGDAGLPDVIAPAPLPPAEVPGDAGADASAPIDLSLATARWRTTCLGQSFPGVSSVAQCEPLRPLPR